LLSTLIAPGFSAPGGNGTCPSSTACFASSRAVSAFSCAPCGVSAPTSCASVGDIFTHSLAITTCGTCGVLDVSTHIGFSPSLIGGGVGDSIFLGSAYSTNCAAVMRLLI